MSTVLWNDALQGVTPVTGGQPLPPATYRLRPVAGEGKLNNNKAPMLSLQFEVASGPLAGRKQWTNENLPTGNTDADKTRMAFFLGLMQAFGITGEQLGQWFAGRPIDAESIDYLAKYLVQQGTVIKATVSPQRDDATRVNVGRYSPDDGIEPEPPKQTAAQSAPRVGPPTTPNGAPAGLPQGGFPQSGPPQSLPGGMPQAGPPQQNQFAPAAQQGGLPLGGFPGSAQTGAPTPAPDWATQQPVQGQAPQQLAGPGQFAPAAQPAAAGMNQFTQPAQGQFPGQQFPGQVDPANFPPQGQQMQQPPAQQGGFQQPAGLPGTVPQGFGQQPPAQAPAGLPQGGFPGGPPHATV